MNLTDAPRFTLNPLAPDLHGEGRALRAAGPNVTVELPGGVPAWAVTTEEAANAALADPRLAKNIQHWDAWQRKEVTEDWPLSPLVTGTSMLHADGLDHRRLRNLVSKAFTARRVEALRPRIKAITRQLLDDLAASGPGAVDLKERFCYPQPMQVICELIGAPNDTAARLRDQFTTLMSSLPKEVRPTEAAVEEELRQLVADKRRTPGDDLTTDLILARDHEDRRLTEAELIAMLRLLFLAGHETTVSLNTNTIGALLLHPDQLALLRTGRQPWSRAVDETLRWDGPVGYVLFRYATEDIELAGQIVRQGEPVIICLAAVGRDHQAHTDADRFDITREPNHHLAFGHGIHYCLGAPLARLEAEIAVPALFQHFPELDLAVPAHQLTRVTSIAINSLTALPTNLGRLAAAA